MLNRRDYGNGFNDDLCSKVTSFWHSFWHFNPLYWTRKVVRLGFIVTTSMFDGFNKHILPNLVRSTSG